MPTTTIGPDVDGMSVCVTVSPDNNGMAEYSVGFSLGGIAATLVVIKPTCWEAIRIKSPSLK